MEGKTCGYVRVSTRDQNDARQLADKKAEMSQSIGHLSLFVAVNHWKFWRLTHRILYRHARLKKFSK